MKSKRYNCVMVMLFIGFSFCYSVWAEKQSLNTKSFSFQVTSEDNKSAKPIIIRCNVKDSETKISDIKKIKSILIKKKKKFIYEAAIYAQEAVAKMTGITPAIKLSNNDTAGIILIETKNLPERLKGNVEIMKILKQDPYDIVKTNEAFVILSEKKCLWVIGNTPAGIADGVVELFESVGYEVLGMGPNWIHIPNYHRKALTFNICKTDRPGFYIRDLWAASGQNYGVGTIYRKVMIKDPADEIVQKSYMRWKIGTRMEQISTFRRGGHALQAYHRYVLEYMFKNKVKKGFLCEVQFGLHKDMPEANEANTGLSWLCLDEKKNKNHRHVFVSNGKKWRDNGTLYMVSPIDFTLDYVRDIFLQKLKEKSEKYFKDNPDDLFIFHTDPEDGSGYARFSKFAKNPNWYPKYKVKENIKTSPYLLDGFNGINQKKERWDSESVTDQVYAFNNWLLREYSKWIDSLPETKRNTVTGKDKKKQIRSSLLSYNYHDVLPHFNLDRRIVIKIAGYAKNQRRGEWKKFNSWKIAKGFSKILQEPIARYYIYSLAYYADLKLDPPIWDNLSHSISRIVRKMHDNGINIHNGEMDFNFGRYGLGYYLMAKMMWNPNMSIKELDNIRDRWFKRSFGSAWKEMKVYYDLWNKESIPISSKNMRAKAIYLLNKAASKVSPEKEPDAVRRIDDVKLYWYYYYLVDTGKNKPDNLEMKEFIWKGQMSYMVAMQMVLKRVFKVKFLELIKPPLTDENGVVIFDGSAHYTHKETQKLWGEVLSHWPYTKALNFKTTTLCNGKKAADVNLHDLVQIEEFQNVEPKTTGRIVYNAANGTGIRPEFFTYAYKKGQPIGFVAHWPRIARNIGRFYKDTRYDLWHWNSKKNSWKQLVDAERSSVVPKKILNWKKGKNYPKEIFISRVDIKAPAKGIYKFRMVWGGTLTDICGLDFNAKTGESTGAQNTGFTYDFATPIMIRGSNIVMYFYIPKGTKSLDVEGWQLQSNSTLTLYKGFYWKTPDVSQREIKIERAVKTYIIPLEKGEGGTIAKFTQRSVFAIPYLYSVPNLYAFSPSALMVPRAIAKADGLTIRTQNP